MHQLVNIQYHATDVVGRKELFETVRQWIDERIRTDDKLDADARNDPESVNLLHEILIGEEPTAIEREAALAFVDMVERFTSDGPVDQIATAAVEIAEGIRQLANEYETLHLTLV